MPHFDIVVEAFVISAYEMFLIVMFLSRITIDIIEDLLKFSQQIYLEIKTFL